MRVQRLFIFSVALGLMASPGCDPALPVGSSALPDNTPSAGLTADEAGQIALGAAKAVAQSAAAVMPLKDLQAIFEFGMPPPACPVLDATVSSGNTLSIELNYGEGCRSSYFADSSLSGKARGVFYAGDYRFSMSFEELAVDGEAVTGSTGGAVEPTSGDTAMRLELSAGSGGVTVRGTANVTLESGGASMRISGERLTATTSDGKSYQLALREVLVTAAANPSLVPQAGIVEIVDITQPSAPTLATVQFAPQTPASGEVVADLIPPAAVPQTATKVR